MKRVYKYTKPIDDVVEFTLPFDAQILHIDTQDDGGNICLWAMVYPSPSYSTEKRKIRIVGTGHDINESEYNLKYINTFTVHNKRLWFHAFEILS